MIENSLQFGTEVRTSSFRGLFPSQYNTGSEANQQAGPDVRGPDAPETSPVYTLPYADGSRDRLTRDLLE